MATVASSLLLLYSLYPNHLKEHPLFLNVNADQSEQKEKEKRKHTVENTENKEEEEENSRRKSIGNSIFEADDSADSGLRRVRASVREPQRQLRRRNHFLPIGQLPNLKGIALHGSPVTELIFFHSNCVSSRSSTITAPGTIFLHRRNLYACGTRATENLVLDACPPTIASIIAPFAELPSLIMGVTRRLSKAGLGVVAFPHTDVCSILFDNLSTNPKHNHAWESRMVVESFKILRGKWGFVVSLKCWFDRWLCKRFFSLGN